MAAKNDYSFEPIRLLSDEPIAEFENDHLGLLPWAKMIAGAAVGTFGPFTIGVHGEWGYGKTTLLRLANKLLADQHPEVVTVWFNAWQFEHEEHPLFPLMAAIAEEIDEKTRGIKGKEQLKKVGLSLRALARGIKTTSQFGIPVIGNVSIELDAEKALTAEEQLADTSNPLQGEMLYYTAFKWLQEILHKHDSASVKIVVFVDDLDRCMPEEAIRLLESIKLILSQPGFIFVLALDRSIIEAHLDETYIKHAGDRAISCGKFYMDKIIQLPIIIPNHRPRFDDYSRRLLHLITNGGNSSQPSLKALKNTIDVLAVGAHTNPRSLVRLVNGFILDCHMWEDNGNAISDNMYHYHGLSPEVTTAIALNRVLHNELAESYIELLKDQYLCDLIGRKQLGDYVLSNSDSNNHLQAGERASLIHDIPARLRVARVLWARTSIILLLDQYGAYWLEDEALRWAVYESSLIERKDDCLVRFPPLIASAIRTTLQIGPDQPVQARNLTHIRTLNIGDFSLSDAMLIYLRELPNLERLTLGWGNVSDNGLSHIALLSSLRDLDLDHTQITDLGLKHLKELRELESLSLSDTHVTDRGLEHLKLLRKLRTLQLFNVSVTDAGVAELTAALPDLQVIR